MQVADLYVRVSTDEQTKGYSPRSQEAVLRQYCQLRNITVRQVFYEDYTAKHFNRPEWRKLMVILRKQRAKTDLLLFTKWDRFSRNTSDAYQMISVLKKLGVDPQAVEQPLDLSIPENKMMLAIYLTAPEIENDRRGLNTKAGIRQAKKEGRYMGKAPKGYINKAYENGRRYIDIKEPEATIMRWVFQEMSEGLYSAESILKAANERGLDMDKNTYLISLRNPVYCGKIRLPEHDNEPAQLVEGLHTALISEALFYKVQDVMNSRSKFVTGLPIASPDRLPLRNFIRCHKCPRMLTGSASKGRKRYSIYYHCRSSCGVRHRAEDVNNAFIDELTTFIPRPGYAELFVESIADAYTNQNEAIKNEQNELIREIGEANKKVDRARELMLLSELEPDEYRKIKDDAGSRIARLEIRLSEVNVLRSNHINVKKVAQDAINALLQLDKLYDDASIPAKRYLVGIIFPEKFTFVDGVCRTGKLNEAAELIYLENKALRAKKMGQKSHFKTLPHKG